VEFGVVFPSGAYAAGAFEPVRNFDASTGEKFVQSNDKASGVPLWAIEVIDPDPAARARAVKVKVAASVQPVIPAAPAGFPFTPVEFTGLTVTPYVNQAGRLAYSIKATDFDARCALPGMRMVVRALPADVGLPWLRETVQQIDAGVPSFGCPPVASRTRVSVS
jgi:hypothetical protein